MTSPSIFSAPDIDRIDCREGSFSVRSRTALEDYPERVLDCLPQWAARDPERLFISQQDSEGQWQSLSYGDLFQRVRALGQFFINQGCNADRPVAVLSENSIASATVILASMYAGVPVVPISAAYATIPEAFGRLDYCLEVITPGAIFVEDGQRFAGVVDRISCDFGLCITAKHPAAGMLSLATLFKTEPTSIDKVFQATGLDTVVKILFTSGSTGTPKGVINTNRMLSANQQQLLQIYPFLADDTPVLLDWLPWSHTFGGNEVFLMALRNGGHLYIDTGKPTPALFENTLKHLRTLQPTVFFNVPLGYDMLATALESDSELCEHFFQNMQMLFYSGSALPQSIWTRLEQLSLQATGKKIPIVTAWGLTETAPLVTGVHFNSSRSDNIGVPVAGCELKFIPSGDRLEIRVKGPQVTPGYWRNAEKTADIFDQEGFFITGDAAYLKQDDDPSAGIIFNGRVSEDFKLSSGTWVAVSQLRTTLTNVLAPLAQDVVVLGQDWDSVCLLIFPHLDACRTQFGIDISGDGLLADPSILSAFHERIENYNSEHTASSMRVDKFAVLAEPPSMQDHEITEKGSINQRAVIKKREALVKQLRANQTPVIQL